MGRMLMRREAGWATRPPLGAVLRAAALAAAAALPTAAVVSASARAADPPPAASEPPTHTILPPSQGSEAVGPPPVPWWRPESGKLLATSGVSQLEGAGGGGLAPWALITGYGTRDATGGNVHGTFVRLPDFTLASVGGAVGLYDRLELSYAHQWFDTGVTGRGLVLGGGYAFHLDVVGAKLRLLGDAVYEQDSLVPQVALGLQYKHADRGQVIRAIGGRSSDGVDLYVAATKLLLDQSLLVNATVRLTKANQLGLLGFGGDRTAGYRPEFEGSAAYLPSRNWAVGAEYRTKPDNLRFAKESDWWDVFVAWFPTKNLSATLAYVDLGTIAGRRNQQGAYLSVQLGF